MSAQGGSKAVLAALGANIGIAVIKFIAFLLTGSSSMLAEAVHSLADSGNQGLLLLGGRRSRRRATAEHPFGFGRDRYVYAFLVALVLFTVGGLFALYEGIHKITDPHHVDSPAIADRRAGGRDRAGALSFRTAIGESNESEGRGQLAEFIRRAKAPELPVVLLEDIAALVGLGFALAGVGLAALLDEPVWDGIGTVAIGVLLIAVAVVLIIETKSLLLGEAASPAAVKRIEAALVADRPRHHRGDPPPHHAPGPGRGAGGGQGRDGAGPHAGRHRRRDRRCRGPGAVGRARRPGDLPGAGHLPAGACRRPVVTDDQQPAVTDRPRLIGLQNAIREYAWGSGRAIPDLLGVEPTGRPAAELWMGAHPDEPSRWAEHPDRPALDELIAADLGTGWARRAWRRSGRGCRS